MMQGSTPAVQSKPLEMGCLESKNVITTDGRVVGVLSGAYVNTSDWTISSLVIELGKEVVSELNVKKPLLRTAKVSVATSIVKQVADVVQLKIDMAGLSTILAGPI
jgi:sporulation protein YlmC with PRC-barrel domain